MWETYDDYCEAMAKFNADPLPYEIWKREYAPKKEVEPPLMVRPKKTMRPVMPTIEKHDPKQKAKCKPKAKPIPKPKQKPKPKAKQEPKPPKERKHIHQRISLEGMTPEEIKAHRAKLQRERIKKKKSEGWVKPPKTPQQVEAHKAYMREYHARNKNDPEYIEKRRRTHKKHDEKRSEARKEKYKGAKDKP